MSKSDEDDIYLRALSGNIDPSMTESEAARSGDLHRRALGEPEETAAFLSAGEADALIERVRAGAGIATASEGSGTSRKTQVSGSTATASSKPPYWMALAASGALITIALGMYFNDPARPENRSDIVAKAEGNARLVLEADLAYRLAAYGQTVGDPGASAIAVDMLVPILAGTDAFTPDDESSYLGAIVADARTGVDEAPWIGDLVDSTLETEARGLVGGPRRRSGRLLETEEYRLTYEGSEAARIVVIADEPDTTSLSVFDENYNLVCESTENPNRCDWTPAWTGEFIVVVQPLRDRRSRYILVSN